MTIEELKKLIPEEKRKEVDKEIDELIEEIKTGANPLTGVTAESFNTLLKGSDELKKILDARMTKGIDTWKEANLEKLYKERYDKENPEETDEQKRIKALEIKGAESDKRAVLAELRADLTGTMTDKKLPTELLPFILTDNQEKIDANLAIVEGVLSTFKQTITDEILKENGRVIEQGNEDAEKDFYSIAQLNEMSAAEQNQNHEKVMKSVEYHRQQAELAAAS